MLLVHQEGVEGSRLSAPHTLPGSETWAQVEATVPSPVRGTLPQPSHLLAYEGRGQVHVWATHQGPGVPLTFSHWA